MSNASAPRDEAELKAFLGRQSPVSEAYAAIEPVPPPEVLDGKILAMARGAVSPAVARASAAPTPTPVAAPADQAQPAVPAAADKPAPPRPPVGQSAPVARPAPRTGPDDDTDDIDDAPPAGRPRWLVPAALAASLLVAVGVGVAMLGDGDSWEPEVDGSNPLGAMFAKRARARSEADKAAAEAAAAQQEAAVVELAPLPPPPVFEPEGPQIEDLDTAIALIRRELVRANQLAAMQEEARAAGSEAAAEALPAPPPPDGAVALVPAPGAEASAGVVQPRDRRLTKILELYDGGNPDLAAASLEIFLRDFEDDPISQRILDAQPRATDIAVD